MREHALALLPDLEAEAHVIALGAVDAAGLELGLEQNVAGVEIAEPHPPGMLALRQTTRQPSLKSNRRPLGPSWVGISAGAG